MNFFNKHKDKLLTLLSILTFGFTLTFLYKTFKDKLLPSGEGENDPLSKNPIFQLNEESKNMTIVDLTPEQRAAYGVVHDRLFETDKWMEEIPAFPQNVNWKIYPSPATRNSILRFLVTDIHKGYSVEVLLDGYGIHSREKGAFWQIKTENGRIVDVPMNDEQALFDEIHRLISLPEPKQPHDSTATTIADRPETDDEHTGRAAAIGE